MKGHIIVSKLTNNGYYVSELDWDEAYKDKENPKGLFKMLIEPIHNDDDEYEIKYMKFNDNIKVSGEAYIITGKSEHLIDKEIAKVATVRPQFIQTAVNDEDELW